MSPTHMRIQSCHANHAASSAFVPVELLFEAQNSIKLMNMMHMIQAVANGSTEDVLKAARELELQAPAGAFVCIRWWL